MLKTLNDHEIRPEELIKNYSKLYNKDVIQLRKTDLITVNCPACDKNDYEYMLTKMNFNFVLCNNCSTVFVNPRPSEESLEYFYSSSKSSDFWKEIFLKTEKIRKEKIFKPRIKLISKIISEYGMMNCNTLVEVGAGYGWFCELAKNQKLAKKIIAIEPASSAEVIKKINGIDVINSTIEKCIDKLKADLIVNFELTHLLFNPKSFLKSCYDGLSKDGILIFSLTNFKGFDIQILKDKSDYIIPTFLNLFNPESIRILLENIGFKEIHVSTPGLMDVEIVLNKIRIGELHVKNQPFLKMISEINNDAFFDDFQNLLQKYNMSSHMLVSAKK